MWHLARSSRLLIHVLPVLVMGVSCHANALPTDSPTDDTQRPKAAAATTADHRKFKALQQEFATGPDVTRACLTCHTEAARQVHGDIHWKWRSPDGIGKAVAVNNC